MKSIIGFITIVVCLSIACLSSANTGVFFGAGNQIIPIKNDQIQLVKENVKITLSVEEGTGRFGFPFIPWANVIAKFYLKNTTQSNVSLQVGFPFMDLQGFGKEKEVLKNLSFNVLSDGVEIKTKLKEGLIEKQFDPKGLFKKVFAWKEQFKPGEEKEVIVTYRMLMGVASANSISRNLLERKGKIFSDIDELIPALAYLFGYITKTAYTWKGEIEEAIFQIDCTALYRELEKHDSIKFLGKRAPKITRPIYLEYTSPNSAKRTSGTYQWKFTGKVPNDGISIGFVALFLPSLPKEVHGYFASSLARLGNIKPDEFKSVIKAYYQIIALGEKPVDPFLKEYFQEIKLINMPNNVIFKNDEKNIRKIANNFEKLIKND